MASIPPTSPSSSDDSTSTRTNADHRWQQFEKTTDRPSFINTFDNLPEGWVILAAEELTHRKPHYLPHDKVQQHRMRQLPFYGWMEPETTFADGTAWPRQSRLASCQFMDHEHVSEEEGHDADFAPCDAKSQETLVDNDVLGDQVLAQGAEAVTARDLPGAVYGKQQRKRRGFFGKIKLFFAKMLGRGSRESAPTCRC
ncbi:hypothetical protein BCR44DRAFT_37684 [Catenaria anguillulae PL171]|uniref:Uncharacterized protein n=1 Tax=Catenaria anguillulae PL171 TaxID=765915 RepID=A0A1Y2I3L4_9FUNG|nr:hypothetical protein BCR44DRAFT_37684 [Catenaria anguillulae PL171]